jgi:glycosyltransferase involved in cell wall biosynthesis
MQPIVKPSPRISLEEKGTISVSLAIFAWNEEKTIGQTLESLFHQTLFQELAQRRQVCEIVCLANGCTDATAEVAARIFYEQARGNGWSSAFAARVENLREPGKLKAWNHFVHSTSARETRFIFFMDADIRIHRRETLWNMLSGLERLPEALLSTDRPRKDISFKRANSFAARASLATSRITASAPAQVCAQLYCLRADTARNIYMPGDLFACDDGFIKALICTDFLTQPVNPQRVYLADQAEHTFEAYTSPTAVLKNQKRQIIGQTIVHVVIDHYLKHLPLSKRRQVATVLRAKEQTDPTWLKQLISGHVRRTRFAWQLHPGLVSCRLKRWAALSRGQRLACAPALAASCLFSLIASFMAYRSLKAGYTQYWPRADRQGSRTIALRSPDDLLTLTPTKGTTE